MAAAGCAKRSSGPEFCGLTGYTGFLVDYSRLEPSPTHPGAWYEQWTALPDYDTFIVDPIKVLAVTTVDCKPIDLETAAGLGAMLRAELIDALMLGGYRIATEPGPRVARIRGAITEISRTQKSSGGGAQIGGASCEMEITDSQSGNRLAAAIEKDSGTSESRAGDADSYFDAKLVFRHWAARLGLWLRGMQEG